MSTLHQNLSDDILKQLQDGRLKIGDKFPPEAEFAATLGVSRSSLRLAFTTLERIGVLERKKRAGTTIIAIKPKPQFNMSTTGLHELLSLGRDTELAITGTRIVRTRDIAQLIDHEDEAAHWLEINGTRTLPGDSMPFNVSQVFVPSRYLGIKDKLAERETSIFRTIEKQFGVSVSRVNQAAQAISCPKKHAKILGLGRNTPALRIVAHLYERGGELMEISVATFDPKRFQLKTDVKIEREIL